MDLAAAEDQSLELWAESLKALVPRGSIYTTYGIRPPKNHPYFGFGDLTNSIMVVYLGPSGLLKV